MNLILKNKLFFASKLFTAEMILNFVAVYQLKGEKKVKNFHTFLVEFTVGGKKMRLKRKTEMHVFQETFSIKIIGDITDKWASITCSWTLLKTNFKCFDGQQQDETCESNTLPSIINWSGFVVKSGFHNQ